MNQSGEFELNPSQREAVEYNDGPLLIIAGAGTGKTKVVVEKIGHIISHNLAKPDEILSLTFTEKAAREMEERIDRAMPYGYFQMWTKTFHSFAEQILRSDASHIGLSPAFSILKEAESILFLRQNLFEFNLKYFRPLGNPNKFLGSLQQHFSRLRDENITPNDYLSWANNSTVEDQETGEKNMELAYAYSKFQELKIKANVLDFGDLIYYLLILFQSRPNILAQYVNQFKYILVDEFQDTNIAQYELIKLLSPNRAQAHLSVVGDDSQAIYKFRGASVSNIMNFMKDYPLAKQVTLRDNYRSVTPILDAAYRLIRHNDPDTLEAKLGISKELVSHKGTGKERVGLIIRESGEEETDEVARTIIRLKKKHEYAYSDFAILVRANSHGASFATSFVRYGIPFRFLGPGALFKQPEIKDLIAYLKVLVDSEDSVNFYRVLTMDIFDIPVKDVHALLSFAKKIARSLKEASEIYLTLATGELKAQEYMIYKRFTPILTSQTTDHLRSILRMMERHMKLLKQDSAAQILYYFLEDSGILKKLGTIHSEREEKIVNNIMKFFNLLKAFEERKDSSIFAVIDYIDLSLEMGEIISTDDANIGASNAVTILTVHGSKGLEFPVVFMGSLIAGRFPTTEKREPIPIPQELIKEMLPEGDYHIEEERRLFYVGATRAMEYLYFTAAFKYGDGKRVRKVSPFIFEALGNEVVEKHLNLKNDEKRQLSLFDFRKPEEIVVKDSYHLTNFSYTQLENYKTCPLQYKYQYILKIPSRQGSAASFGDTIHKTLQQFYIEFENDRSINLSRLLDIYESMWTPLGYSTKKYEMAQKHEGIQLLTSYFQKFHPPLSKIMSLEKLFKIKIEDDIFITGKIDRIDESSGGEIEIIDYKTGRKPDDKELRNSLQLSIYAIAATDKGLYGKPLDMVNLTFYYLQTMEKITMKKSMQDITNVKEEIINTVADIRKNEFLPKVSMACSFCSFKPICPAWEVKNDIQSHN